MRRDRVRRMVHGRQAKIGLAMIVVALMAAPVAVFAKGGNAPATVDICHLNGASDIIPGLSIPGNLWAFGQVISVPETAVPGHEGHGDSTTFQTADSNATGWNNLHTSADNNGLTIWAHADCFVDANP